MKFALKIVIVCSLFIAFSSIAIAQSKRPNIVFCLADDWGWPHAGAYGDTGVKTPNFDRLAREGVLFQHAYVSSPSCTPSRNAFITGKQLWQLGSGANLHSTLPIEHESFILMLAENGYVTGRTKAKTWGPGNIKPWQEHYGSHPGSKAYNDIAEFFDKTDAKEKPFFFWLGTSDPHRPYDLGSGKASGIDISKVHMFKHYPDSDIIRSDIADYYFEVQRWDTLVGSTMAELQKHGLLDNTIIIMTGDHGMPFPRCKGNLYDCGVRVPFAVRWPQGIKPGRQVTDFISFADIAPTLLELTGVDIPAEISGHSFASVLTSDKSGLIDPVNRSCIIFGRERHVPAQEAPDMGGYPSRGYRDHKFLYIKNFTPVRWPAGTARIGHTNYPNQWLADCDGGPSKNYIFLNKDKDPQHRRAYQLCFAKRPAEELYDVINDPDELNNLASDPVYAEKLAELRTKLQGKLAEFDDPRADEPGYTGFDGYPYLGAGGGKMPREVKEKLQD